MMKPLSRRRLQDGNPIAYARRAEQFAVSRAVRRKIRDGVYYIDVLFIGDVPIYDLECAKCGESYRIHLPGPNFHRYFCVDCIYNRYMRMWGHKQPATERAKRGIKGVVGMVVAMIRRQNGR